jgi:PAS domain S-box-containing protein
MAKKKKLKALPGNATEIILESISDGVFTVDHNWHIMSFNRAAEEITGISRAEAIDRPCWEVFRSNMCEGDCALRRTMKEKKSFVSSSTYIINSHKKRIPITVSTSLLKNENGEVLGGVETFRDISLVEELRKELTARFQMGDMISRSPSMQKIFKILPHVAESESTILIQGETGTGKELLARAIHNLSRRKDKPFLAINCGALPDSLLESELFGYKAGAFTNATKDKPGRFEVAKGGTILLDEIGDISPAFQARLLRVLEEGEFQPLGAVKTRKTNARIIAATNKNLKHLVERGDFRRDLFYRINVVNLNLPPLRERKEDIPLLVKRFINKLNKLRQRAITGLDQEALKSIINHDFPGNIRELENIIEHAFILCPNGLIQISHLPAGMKSAATQPPEKIFTGGLKKKLKVTEAQTIIDTLKQNNYNRLAAAKALGMHKSTLFRKINKLKIDLPKEDGRSKHKPS